MNDIPGYDPEKHGPLTPEQRSRIARVIAESGRQLHRITPTQAAVLGFPTRDPETDLLVADMRLFTFGSDGTL